MSYATTRRLVLAGGLVVLGVIAAILYLRRVDTVEVVAVLLFVPVFFAFVLFQLPGGTVAGVLAAAAYAALRLDAIDAVGAGRFTGLIATRTVGYIAFGVLGGWAVAQLERSLDKLDIYDQIDDDTGLYNARFFLQETDLEMSRAQRYRTLFSVAVVDVPGEPVDALPRRKRAALLNDIGRALHDAVRTVDRAVHGRVDGVHRFAVICPETGEEGARIFTTRMADSVSGFLRARGLPIDRDGLRPRGVTFPGDEDELAALREDFARLERVEHPEHPFAAGGQAAPPAPDASSS